MGYAHPPHLTNLFLTLLCLLICYSFFFFFLLSVVVTLVFILIIIQQRRHQHPPIPSPPSLFPLPFPPSTNKQIKPNQNKSKSTQKHKTHTEAPDLTDEWNTRRFFDWDGALDKVAGIHMRCFRKGGPSKILQAAAATAAAAAAREQESMSVQAD